MEVSKLLAVHSEDRSLRQHACIVLFRSELVVRDLLRLTKYGRLFIRLPCLRYRHFIAQATSELPFVRACACAPAQTGLFRRRCLEALSVPASEAVSRRVSFRVRASYCEFEIERLTFGELGRSKPELGI
eukprot:598337-Pleurochrysis_carterae.AAC.1